MAGLPIKPIDSERVSVVHHASIGARQLRKRAVDQALLGYQGR
jgi:hypothetical protein